MIPTYVLFFIFFSILCKVTVQTENTKFNESNDCKCGRRDDHSFRIVGGREAEAHSHPWMTAIYSQLHNKIYCGGALINDRYVITAGHCVKTFNKWDLNAVLGLHDKDLFRENKQGLVVRIDDIIIHENFKSISFYDVEDVALLKLSEKINFTKEIKPICLPKNSDEDYENNTAHVMGWGKTFYKVGEAAVRLKETDLRVLPKEECKSNKVIGNYLLDSMLCAYGENTDACQGDSGGPLVYETASGKVELIGVVSWGIQCAKPDTPGIYSRVTHYIDWIAEHTKDAVYCKNS